MDTERTAIAFPVPVVALADILHTPLAVPVLDHGDKYITAGAALYSGAWSGFRWLAGPAPSSVAEPVSIHPVPRWPGRSFRDDTIPSAPIVLPCHLGSPTDGW